MLRRRFLSAVTLPATFACWLVGCSSVPEKQHSSAGSPVVVTNQTDQNDANETQAEAHAHYAQGLIYELTEDNESAVREFTLAAKADPSNERLVLDLARRELQRNHPDQALEILLPATALPNASGELFIRLAQVYVVLGKESEALLASQTAVKRSPGELGGYLNGFLLQLKRGRSADALAILNLASRQPNTSVEFLVGLAELYSKLQVQAPSEKENSKPGAESVLKRAAALNPSTPFLRLKLAEDFYLLGDSKSATKIYQEIIDGNPESVALREEARARLADIYLRGSNPQQATEQLKEIVKENPTNPQAYYFLGTLAIEAKKYDEALDHFQKALLLRDDFRESEQAYYTIIELQIQLNRVKPAFETLEKVRKKYPNNYRIEVLTAQAYSREKDYTNAVTHFTSAEIMANALSKGTLTEFFYFQLGAAHERVGDLAPAVRAFEKALELKPDFAEALNYYGYMLADRGEQLDRARKMIEKALKQEPMNVAFLDSLAWVLFKQNQPEAALSQIEKAVSLSEEPDATLFDHLGDICAALKKTDRAREAWRKSLELEKNEQIQKKLNQPPT